MASETSQLDRQIVEIEDPQERRIAAALRAAQIGVFEFEPATGKAFWDSRVRQIWNVPEDEEITYETVVAQVHPEDRQRHDEATAQALDPKGSRNLDFEYRLFPRGGGPMRWLHALGACSFKGDTPVRLIGTVQDVTQRRTAEERNILLLHELEHRVKNTLATALAVVNMSKVGQTDVDSYADAVRSRLFSMAQSHDTLRRSDWKEVDLHKLVQKEADVYLSENSPRFVMTGDPVLVPAQHVLTFSLAVHELFTNAAKYGALSNLTGRIHLKTEVKDGRVHFNWRETGGPTPLKPAETPSGFGSFLLRNVLVMEMKARLNYDVTPNGAIFELDFPKT